MLNSFKPAPHPHLLNLSLPYHLISLSILALLPGLENLSRLAVALPTDRFENLNLTAHFFVNGL